MGFFGDRVVETGSQYGVGYGLRRGAGYFSGDESKKSIWWAILTLIGSVAGYITGQVSGDIALVLGSNAVQSIWLWCRARKTQKSVLAVETALEYNTQVSEQARDLAQSVPAAAEQAARQAAEERVAVATEQMADALAAKIEARFAELEKRRGGGT